MAKIGDIAKYKFGGNHRFEVVNKYEKFGTPCILLKNDEGHLQMMERSFKESYTTKMYYFSQYHFNKDLWDFETKPAKRKFKEKYNHLSINKDFPSIIYFDVECLNDKTGEYIFHYYDVTGTYSFPSIRYKFRNWK